MATPAHATRMACSDQTKNPDGSGDPDGPESSLKNGTTFEDSEDSAGSGNMVVKNRGSSQQQHGGGREPASMEQQFQDGGGGGCAAPQPNSRPASGMSVDGSYNVGVDRSRMNSDFQSFNQTNAREPNPMVNDDFRTAGPDGYNHGCELGYPRGGYVSGDMGNSSASSGDISSNSQPNKMYPQYNQSQMRPGYGQSPRNLMGPQQRSPGPTMGRYPTGGSSQQQQRFLLGPSIAQQTGPTPTLNQLLQAPNSMQRYHNSYEYSSNQGLHKSMGDPNPQYPGPNSSWGGMRASGYQQPQQMGSSMYRNQGWHCNFESWLKQPKVESKLRKTNVGGPNMGDPSMKRPYGGPTGGQISSPTPGPSPQGPQQQYPPPPQQQQQQQPPPQQQQQQQPPPPPQQQTQGGSGPVSEASMKRSPYGGPAGNQLSSPSTGPSSQGNQPQQQQQYTPQPYHHQYGPQSQGTPAGVRPPPMSPSYPQQVHTSVSKGVQQYSSVQQPSPSQGQTGPVYDHQRQQQPPPPPQPVSQYGSGAAQSHLQPQQPQQTPMSQQPQQQQQQQPSHTPPQHHQQPPTQQQQQQHQQQQIPTVHQQQQPPPIQQQQQQQQQQQPSQQPQPQSQQVQQQQQQPQQPQQQQPPPPHLQQQTPPIQDVSGTGNGCSIAGGGTGGSAGDDASSVGDPSPSNAGGGGGGSGSGSTTPGLRTPATPPHPVVSPHRPVPSPSGPPSVGSPSMSSSLGQQQNIPMPPRPSSSQSDGSGPSPMPQPPPVAGTQGYNQHMAPPSMYGNKMHQGMMGASGSPVAPYSSHQPSGHYAQGGYHRAPNSMNVQGYGSTAQSQSPYPGPMSGSTYPPQSSMPSHRMSSHTGAGPNNYSSPSPVGYPNAQYGTSGPPPTSGYGMSNMMPPPNQYPKSNTMPPPTGGAQAAAQAAVMAAAASSGSVRQSPMYLRQHLQQKMYPGGYGGSSLSPVPPGASGPAGPPMGSDAAPMPPPSSTPSSSQATAMGQSSPMPPQVSTPGAGGSSCDSNTMQSSMGLAGYTQTSAPSLGPPVSTTTTQSMSSPVPSVVTVSSPSVMGSDMMQSQQGRGPMGMSQGPPPPPIIDEGSQASNASASSSLPEERVETPKPNNKPPMSHPPTPNALSSPGAASMSSFHDEFESVSSPSWPRTPASPVINNQTYDHHPIKRPDGMLKLYDMSDEPDRRMFLDKLIMYNEERGTPISQCPTISKQPLDLYRLYIACKERGGFAEVMKAKLWKDLAGLIGIGASSSAAYTLRKQYIKHLLPFECKYDRGGIDPGPLINSFESNSRKKNAVKNAMMNQEGYHQGGPMMDGYSSPYPGAYPPSSGPHPSMMPNADYPGHHPPYSDSMHPGGPMVNHSGSEGAVDPFSDDMATATQYPPQRHSSGDGYGYSQPSTNSGIPPYSGNQSSMAPSGQYGPYSNAPVSQQEPYGDQYPNSMGPPSSESSYGGRSMVSDPYAPPGGYPPNRTVGPANPPNYPPYQGPCDQERYDQPATQGPMMRPQSSGGMGASPQDPSAYPPPHRYPSPSMASRESMPAQQMGSYQGRPPMPPQSQYQGPNSQPSTQSSYPQSQPDSYRGSASDYPPQMSRLQSTLIQRLQPKNHTAQGMYGQTMAPPNKVAPQTPIPGNMYQRDMYQMGPKRHGDYSKPPHGPAQDQYHMGSYPQQQTQGPYGDRSQYPYRPTHGVPSSPGPQPGWSRDGRPYPSGPNQYQANHRDGWDVSRHNEGPSPGSAGWPRYSGPQQDLYSQHMGPGGMGPKMGLNRGYMSPNKMPPHPGPPSQYGPSSARKEIIFPPDSVEAVSPVMSKRRRLLAKDLTPIDPWRIVMALKSGLLCESTWALDVLSILICDDSTVLYFGLSHMPGLLEVLMDHYRCCLNLIFDLLVDLEVGFIAGENIYEKKTFCKSGQKWYELDRDACSPEETLNHSKELLNGDSIPVLKTTNYTQRTRCRKYVRTHEEEALFLVDPEKKWDVFEGFISGSSHWQHGGGESTIYIQTHFENEEKNVRFVRIMEEVKKKHPSNEDENDKNSLNTEQETCPKTETPKDENLSGEDNHYSKKECGSDTEEDEGLCSSMPSPHETRKNKEKDAKSCSNDSTNDKESSENTQCDRNSEDAESKPNDVDENDDAIKDESMEGDANSSENKLNDSAESKGEEEAEIFPKVRPTPCNRKRKTLEEMEDEAYNRDEPSLCTTTDAQDSLIRRCICISTLLRNLSFVPGNDTEMSKHPGFLMVMGRLLLLNHVHSPRKPPQRHYDREEDNESTSVADSCSSLNCDQEWWWDMLHLLRENTLVTLANIAGQLDLAPFPEEISFPLLDGLMHWVTCPSSYAQDPLPTQPSQSVLSPQRLSLEALCKLSVLESNVDLMMATPPWQRIDRFFSLLAKWLSRNEDQVLREFSVVLLSNLSQADSSMARAIALQGTCIPLLITFVEQAEQSALQVANSQGINALRENPELMGTTLDMVRRAAGTLRCLARVPSNRTLFLQHQQRLLALVMSQILDQGVASIIADVLFECSQEILDEALCSGSTTTTNNNVDRSSTPASPVVAIS